ncbi:hypothetical protein DPEC_G00209700 [Dallia pectoralis]|uniref:Uncharacterized protein n=1 Tax=Dallia pectoralis TaxID=75939 RepID=A0ACC2G5M5_DALPE|nr:hypothetical protein DPEC_G00209700 [Dallia pectoralis]
MTHLQETVISTFVAGMFPVIGSNSYTEAMSSSLSMTSPSISVRAQGGSGPVRDSHSLAPVERVFVGGGNSVVSPLPVDRRTQRNNPVGETWQRTVLENIMQELAFYPAVALIYFFGVLRASQEDRVELAERASVNVFCLFVLAQPLCLVVGRYTGMLMYLITALVSYNFLPWKETAATGQKRSGVKEGKEKKKKTN